MHQHERTVKQNPFKSLGELHKEWTEAGVRASRATTHRPILDMDYTCVYIPPEPETMNPTPYIMADHVIPPNINSLFSF